MMPVAGGFVPAVANGYTHGATGPPPADGGGGADIGRDGGGEVGQAPAPAHAGPNMHFTGPAAVAAAAAAAGAGDDADALGKNNTGAIPSVLSLVTILLLHPNADNIFETARANVGDAVILLREVLEEDMEKDKVESESNSEHRTLPSLELMDTKTIAMVLEVAEKVRSEYKRNKEEENEGGTTCTGSTRPPADSVVDEARGLGPDGFAKSLAGLGGGVAGVDAPGLLPGRFAGPYFEMFQKALDTYWKMAHDYWEYKSWEEWSVRPCENPACPKKGEKNVNTKPCFAGRYYCSVTCHIAVENAAAENSI